eukprot:CAMPEP_0202469032 /NCGR_PEP_ID=MMETSP1360-20130828/77222_1 /ASSEMBLY_ACC=CAM_ASM_000848 /TAXON_ID=515479 /ORGANISM="Licmophora paradoxa, Strain CCMP2313" /LENGTH=69 /DNA_ID=CAMNT_0049094213 /DNA_START=35 /DNA_END=241 /DNA_ORIENTATION=-
MTIKTNRVSGMDTDEGGMAFLNKHEKRTASSGREQNSGCGRGQPVVVVKEQDALVEVVPDVDVVGDINK